MHAGMLYRVVGLFLFVGVASANLVRLAPNTAYVYNYAATSRLGDISVFVTKAKVHVGVRNISEAGYLCQLTVERLSQNANGRNDHSSHWDFTKWFSFFMTRHGEVTEVFYPPEENLEVLNIKKSLVGTLSARLHATRGVLERGSKWMYMVNETGHEGEHLTTYQVQQSADGLVFHRTKHGHAVKNAQAKNEKEMTYKHDIGFPHQIRVVESFTAPRKTAEGFDSAAGLPGDPGKHGKLQGDTFDLPMMHANSTSHMTFVGMTSLAADVIIPSNLTTGSLIIVQPRQPDLPLKDVEKDIVGNLTCVRKHLTKHQSATRSTCFLQLVKLVSRLSDHDIGVLSRRFVKIRHQHQGEEENCNIMVDVLGSVGTESAQRLLTFNVLQAEGAPAKLIQRMLISYVSMQTPPIEDFLRALEELCFTRRVQYQDPRDEWLVHNTAVLILGAVADRLKHTDPKRAQELVKLLEENLGIHDPWHHRQLRETLTVDELKRHNHEKATLLQALGNAEFDSSFHHLVSYLNNTDSPTLLRTSALSAIRKYKHDEAAGLLLDSALFDEEEHVRYHAALQYQRHPKALNLRKMKQDQANGSVNVSHYLDDVISLSTAMSQNPHLRKRRGFVGEVVHALTEGIQFEMKLPGVDWKRKIGTDSIGAEFGLIMKNKFDLDIRLSEGHAKLDIYDHAYARGLLGVLDMTFDFMDTGICFSGGIYYKVNILQDYNFKQLLELIKSWFREVPAVIKDVKDTINTFKNLFAHLANTTPEEVFKAILDAIQTFPDRITAISRWTRDTMEKIGAYDNLPTFIVEARQVILRIATLFNDVKKDVTELVNTIADSIHVVLPWGAEQIWQGLQTISREISNLIRSPQTAAGNIAKAVYRIYYAVRGLISMKDQIDEVCFFKEGKQPYWFNLRTQIEEILDDIEHVWRLFEVEAPTWVDGIVAHSTDVLRQAFSHQTRRSLRREVIDEFKAALNDLPNQIGPTAHIIQPFLDAYTSTVGTVKKVKSYYDSLKQGYTLARSIIHKIFGPKASFRFPRRILDSETCGIGTYPSFGVVTATYTSKGIDLKIRKGRKVVAPFAGEITSISEEKITIASEDIKDMEIIIEGVEVEATLEEGQHIHKGGKVGKAAATGCRENSIHFAIKAVGAEEYVDPTRYLRKPMMTNEENKPGWRSECDVYWLTLLDKSIATGNLTDILKDEDETPEEPEVEVDDSARSSTTISSLSSTTYKRRSLKREIAVALTNNPDFAQSIGVDNMTDITKTFSVKLQDLKLSKVLDILQLLDGAETAALRDKLHSTAEQLQQYMDAETFKLPGTLTDDQLRWELQKRGKATNGSREQLVRMYTTTTDNGCPNIFHHLNKLPNIFCNIQDDCMGFRCYLSLPKSPHTVVTTKASVRFDPCTMKLTLEIGDHKEEKSLALPDFAEEDEYNNDQSWTLFENMLLVRSFRVQRNGSTFKLRLAVKLCAGSIDRCLPPLNLLKDVIIGISPCDGARDATPPTRQTPVMDLTLSQLETELHHISRAEMRRILPEANLTDMNQLLQDLTRVLRASYKEVLVASIDMAVEEAVQELLSSDSYLNGSFPLGPWDKTFFEVKVPFTLGPITMYLKFAAGGYIGVTLEAGVSIMKMKAYGKATPDVSAVVEASVGVSILLIAGELQLKGYILTTAFPTTAEVTFDKFPLNVGVRMDMVMIPLRLELHGVVFILGGKIIDIMIWHYETSSVTKNIFNTGLPEPDLTPPKFRKFKHKNQASSPLGRRSEVTTHCDVEQLPGRDVMEPAFQLAVDAEDDVSQVKLTYDVGTYQAGSDVVKGEELGGPSNIIVRPMKGGVPLYFTVTAKNSGSGDAKVTCELPTYDVTLPGGRVTPDFLTTSHPSILRASAVAHDDSQIIHKLAAVGYGRKVYGDQIMAWHDVNTTTNTAITTGQGVSALDRFTGSRLGKVVSTPVETSKVDIPEQCASKCLRLPPSKCLSFNYDYGHGDCELLEEIEGHGVEMHEVGHFHSFERLGVGHAMEFRHENLKLHHNQLYFFNFFLNNTLGYVNILTSRGVLADFTPPSPGLLQNVNMDVLMTEACEDFVLDHWEQARCVEQSPLQNHRWIVDGEGSQTVFNGHEPLVDMRYTRANRYVSANWDGFHDDETGIHGYSWTVGTTPCEEDVHPHIDPHAHLLDVSEWTHQGIASPLFLIDGVYHITVRAINNVEFGGAMATTVCHTTPYIIDNTPPFVHHVHSVQYDEDALVISAEYDVSDPLSDIREIDFGLGWSKRDVHMMDWYRHGNTTHTSVNFHIPDGIPAWVKVRAINNVDLREVGHAEYPLLVDTSPPIAGVLYDGSVHGHDLNFTSDPNTICANWKDFHDEQSGLSHYLWGVVSAPGTDYDDIVPLTEYPHTASQACADVQLIHNTTYYSMLVAVNNGHKHLNVSAWSDGVLFDATPPVEGTLRDGLEPDSDLEFSSEPSTVSANWDGYRDPESGIGDYAVTVQRTKSIEGNGTQSPEIVHEKSSVGPGATQINWHKFHLHHGDHVTVQLEATNQAKDSTVTSSDGFIVDLTKPVMVHLGDGPEPGQDREFSADASRLSANWIFEDSESGIKKYKISVYKAGGTRRQIYPERGRYIELSNKQTSWTSPASLDLSDGAQYLVRVSAVNGAGAATVHETDGVIVDTSPPDMVSVKIGVTAGEPEELEDGYVLHTDLQGIQAAWLATDFESGVVSYWVAVGTTPGGNDVSDYRNVGTGSDGYIGNLNLQLTNKTTNSPVYYLTVKAENAAGSFSTDISSSPIKVVRADQVGTVTDGWETWTTVEQAVTVDVDYQRDVSTVTVQFSGFESEQHGISHYEWSVGTEPRLDDVQPYTAAGVVLSDHTDNPGGGLSSHGQAQSLLPLTPGVQYYATVRAVTGSGNVLDFSTDGFTVDITPPVIQIDSVGVQIGNNSFQLDWERSHYQKSADSISANWGIIESEDAIACTWFCYGSYPGACDVFPVTNTTSMSVPNSLVKPKTEGMPNVLTVSSMNAVGLWGQAVSGSLTVDETPPVAGEVFCPQFVQHASELSCRWQGFYDTESSIQYYMFGVGTAEGDDSVFNFTRIPSHQTHYSLRRVTMVHDVTYYVTVVGYNAVEDSRAAYSAPIVVDNTPPIVGVVVELSGDDNVNVTTRNGENNVHCTSEQECKSLDVRCQKSSTQVAVAWEPFHDPETYITRYEVALGTSPGGGQLHDFMVVDAVVSGQNVAVVSGLDLSDVRLVFATVRGTNAAGLSAISTSNGVYISRISAGLQPLREPIVSDGEDFMKDLDYQDHNEELSAHWDFSGDPCPISQYEWSILKVDGTVVQPFTAVPPGQEYANNNELKMQDGETFFIAVRATNEMDFSYTVRSDGITVMLEPLIPGEVRDGDIVGYDLNFQPSVTSVSANWDRFGQNRDNVEGSPQGQRDEDKEQTVEFYEVALGTDRRFPRTRNNVRPFINVGLNRTHTFNNLQLIPRSATYYITVRAHSLLTSVAEVTSNGIQVGYGGQVLSVGHVNVNRYISSTTSVSFSWRGFAFALPVLYSHWAIGTMDGNLTDLACRKLQICEREETEECASLMSKFNVHPMTNVGKDTAVDVTDLELFHNKTYTVVVIVTDQSAECSLASSYVTVDVTPPSDGSVWIGASKNSPVSYSDRTDELHVSWADFSDPESGIDHYEIAVFSGADCSVDSGERFQVTDFVPVPSNYTECIVTDISLEPGIPYFVKLRTFNKAGLSIMTESSPILLDLEDPVGGTVKDGRDFSSDITHQSSTTSVEGTFIYLATHDGERCPSREYLMDTEEVGWNSVSSNSVLGLRMDHRIMFSEEQLTFGEDGLSISMWRDVQHTRMYSGAYSTRADMQGGGSYTFDMIAASGDIKAVSSVVFWDGPAGVVGDLEAPVEQWAREEAATEPPDCTCCLRNNTSTNTTLASAENKECFCNCTYYHIEGTTSSLPLDTTSAPNTGIVDYAMAVGASELSSEHIESRLSYRSCGLQIHTGIMAGGVEGNYAVLWCRFENDTVAPQQEMINLDFDPTDGWHSYELKVTVGKTFAVGEDWSLELIIDGASLVIMNGIPVFSEHARLTLSVWNRDDFVPDVQDIFTRPEATSFFRNLRFPPSTDNLCRFGDPFRPGTNSVSVFYAGVGTEKMKDDVAPFREVARPCVPCVNSCNKFNCDPDCSNMDTTAFHVRIDDLTLSPNVSFKQLDGMNLTDATAVYYITVKAVSGSGRTALACSSGVQVDVTPPDIQGIDHVDMSWDDEEIVEYQGSNSTIAVRYSAFDRESQVAEYFWAIGTAPWGTDIQPFMSNGLRDMAVNSDLEGVLQHGSIYFVTLLVVNGAGLESSMTSSGVKVLLGYPNVTQMNTTVLFGEDVSDDVYPDDVVEVADLAHAGFTWERPQEEQAITSIFFSVSSSQDGIDDIFPKTRVGFNDSGSVVIADGRVSTGGQVVNITDMKQRGSVVEGIEESSRFFMEPGRTLYPKILACNGAHRCAALNVNKITYIRPWDHVATSRDGEGVEVVLNKSNSTIISITTPGGLRKGTSLVSGLLDDYDVSTEHTSDASAEFKSFIADPRLTKDITDRWLRNRLKYWMDVNFFLTTLGNVEIPGPINITLLLNITLIEPGLEPRLLYWNSENQQWQDAQRECDRGENTQTNVHWTEHRKHFQVCTTNVYTEDVGSGQARLQRSAEDSDQTFRGPTHFSLVAVEKNFLNSRPVIISHSRVQAWEDEEKVIWIRYFDLDGDRLSFSISASPMFGNVRLQEQEEYAVVYYSPFLDYYGTDKLNITAVEMLPNNLNPHSINIELVVEVEPRNDDPVLFVLVEDNPALIVPTKRLDLTVEVNRVSNVYYRDLVVIVGAYDVETADTLSLDFSVESNDTMSTSQQLRQVDFLSINACNTNTTWYSVVREHVENSTSGPLQLDPCDIQAPHPLQDMAWVFTTLTYRPHENFTGTDVFQINAKDQHGGLSRVVTLDLYVLENLCQHGGECVSDVTDPDCTSKDRAKGFDGYWCNCTSAPGWAGRLCETDYDECLSTPCPRNYTCVDQVSGYVCECGNPSWPCAGYLEAWQICLIVMAAFLLLVLVMVVWRKWKKSSVKRAGSMFLRGSKVSPGTTLMKVSQHHADKSVNGLEPSKANSSTGPDIDRPATYKVHTAWEDEDDNTPDRQAAALLNWEWNPNRSAESRDLPSSLLSGAVTELKPLRGTLLKPTKL
ncbi:uncharacterized protein LOC144924477 [Branchiostoma floridae x Branchiostoma belcheri]